MRFKAWAVTKGGPNIIITTIDRGVTDNHVDLPSSRQLRYPGSNFAFDKEQAPFSNPDDPSPNIGFIRNTTAMLRPGLLAQKKMA